MTLPAPLTNLQHFKLTSTSWDHWLRIVFLRRIVHVRKRRNKSEDSWLFRYYLFQFRIRATSWKLRPSPRFCDTWRSLISRVEELNLDTRDLITTRRSTVLAKARWLISRQRAWENFVRRTCSLTIRFLSSRGVSPHGISMIKKKRAAISMTNVINTCRIARDSRRDSRERRSSKGTSKGASWRVRIWKLLRVHVILHRGTWLCKL